jgi:NitT/TauT family transport system substrate-binding protein
VLILIILLVACDNAPAPAPSPTPTPTSTNTPAAAVAATTAPSATPAKGPPLKLAVAVGPPSSPASLPLDLAKALKYFEAEGLDVDVRHMAEGSQAPAMLSGVVLFAAASLDTPVKVQPQGKTLKMIPSLARLPGIVVLVRADLKSIVKSPADFKGRKIGVSAIGSDTHVLLTLLASRAGLKPEDYSVAPVGASTLGVAFDKKEIDVGLGADPFATPLLKSGAAVAMADLRTQADADKFDIGEYQSAGLIADVATLKSQPQTAQQMVNAIRRAIAYLKAHSARELADLLPDDVTGKDKQAWIDAYTASMGIYPADGKVSQDGVANAVAAYRLFGAINPAEKINVAGLYDNTFVESAK